MPYWLFAGSACWCGLYAISTSKPRDGTIPPLGFNSPSQNNGGTSSSSGSNPPGQNNGGSSPPQTQAGGGGDQLPPKGPPPAAAPPNPEGGQDPRIAKSGTLRDLANKGYKMNSHFVDEFLKEKGLSVGDVENILKNGDYYHRYIDAFDRITGKTLGRNPRIFTIVYNQFADQLHTIFEGGIPSNPSSFESLPNPFDP